MYRLSSFNRSKSNQKFKSRDAKIDKILGKVKFGIRKEEKSIKQFKRYKIL